MLLSWVEFQLKKKLFLAQFLCFQSLRDNIWTRFFEFFSKIKWSIVSVCIPLYKILFQWFFNGSWPLLKWGNGDNFLLQMQWPKNVYCGGNMAVRISVLREWILKVREVKSEMKICFTLFEKWKWNKNDSRSRTEIKKKNLENRDSCSSLPVVQQGLSTHTLTKFRTVVLLNEQCSWCGWG